MGHGCSLLFWGWVCSWLTGFWVDFSSSQAVDLGYPQPLLCEPLQHCSDFAPRGSSKQEYYDQDRVTVLYTQISQVTSQHFCHIIRDKSCHQVQPLCKGIIQVSEGQGGSDLRTLSYNKLNHSDRCIVSRVLTPSSRKPFGADVQVHDKIHF